MEEKRWSKKNRNNHYVGVSHCMRHYGPCVKDNVFDCYGSIASEATYHREDGPAKSGQYFQLIPKLDHDLGKSKYHHLLYLLLRNRKHGVQS
jgi:hypothetical protein